MTLEQSMEWDQKSESLSSAELGLSADDAGIGYFRDFLIGEGQQLLQDISIVLAKRGCRKPGSAV